MARLKGASILIGACRNHAAYLGVLLLVKLGLGVPHWLALGVAHYLPIARGFT